MKRKGFRLLVEAWLLALLPVLPFRASGDGMVVPQTAYSKPTIMDQQALIHYADNTETLVIETSFVGKGTNFAWVVPVPAVPRIETVSGGVFPTLEVIFQPLVVLSVRHYWLALPITALFIWLFNQARRSVLSAFVAALMVLCAVLLFGPLFLSAASRASASGATTGASVRILSHETVGVFDTITVQSRDPAALLRWLADNGYSAPTNAASAVAEYVRDGWVFVAARLNSNADEGGRQATHPLAFTFPTTKPVYPLRLTGKQSATCTVDLYVFGPSRAGAPNFAIQRCEAPNYDAAATRPRLTPGPMQIRQAELSKLVARAPVTTKLHATLNARAMAHDAYLTWEPYRASGGKVYTKSAALTLSGNVCALLFAVLVLVWWTLPRVLTTPGLLAEKVGPWLAPASIGVGLAMFCVALPKVDMSSLRLTRAYWGSIRNDSIHLAMILQDEMGDTNAVRIAAEPARPLSAQEIKKLAQAVGKDFGENGSVGRAGPLINVFTGEPIRFEASPGNVVLRTATSARRIVGNITLNEPASGYELVWHDLDGAEVFTNSVIPQYWKK